MIEGLKAYPRYKDSGVAWLGEVPEHWGIYRGKALFRCIDVRSLTGNEELLTVSSERGVVPRRLVMVTMFKAESYIGYKLCWPGDLVINSLWAWARGLGVSQHHGIISSAYGVYRLRQEFSDYSKFIHELVRSAPFQWELQVRSKGIWISRLQLTDDAFLDAPFPLPSPSEQSAIVRFLNHADRRIQRYIRAKKKLIALLNEQKQAIIHHAVTRGLDPDVRLKPSGVEWLGDVPEHWEVLALKRVLYSLIDCEHKTAPAVDISSYRVVRTTAVRNGMLRLQGTYFTTEEGFHKWTRRGVPEPGDVVFTREAPAGEACIVPTGYQLCLGQRTVLMKLHKDRYNAQYLIYMIYGGPPANRIKLASQGSTVGHFNMDDIAALTIFAPPLREQEAIVKYVEDATHSLAVAEERAQLIITLLQEYRTRLIADLVTGKLDVREAAAALPDEPDDDASLDDIMAENEEDLEPADAMEEAEP